MSKPFRVAIASDHGGFELKQQLLAHLKSQGWDVEDCGTNAKEPAVDYPRMAAAVAERVSAGQVGRGIVIDGAGIGSAMAANKFRNVRAAACYNEALARNSREHNDANVLTLGAGQTNLADAKQITDVFLSTDCTADRHRARVQIIKDFESRTMSTSGKGTASQMDADDLAKIAERVKSLLGGASSGSAKSLPIPADKVAKLIDHTLLKADASLADVQKLCAEAKKFNFCSVCVNSSYVRQARQLLRESPVKVCCVVGFPLGAQPPEIKALEARRAIREGAQEVDMVINIGALKNRDDALILKDIRAVVEACKESRVLSKVILETSLLTDEEKVRACEASMKAGADFVKTSTGFSTAGATVADIQLMARTVAPRKLGVKASGGVRTYQDVVNMVNAGATRVGCSSSVKIMEEASGQKVSSDGGKGY